MKILFIQLPLSDHGMQYIDGNIPYAPATIAAYIKRIFGTEHQVNYLPIELANFTSDTVILRYIENVAPDVISFTNYLWNVERHLDLAAMVKNKNNMISVIFGGPEIHEQSSMLKTRREQVDYFVFGEGEWFFGTYLQGPGLSLYTRQCNGNKLVVQPADMLLPAAEMVEPFTSNMLNPQPDGSIFLEMTRGCPYKCSYCYYSKNSDRVRECSMDLLRKAIGLRQYFSLSEIYILSPTFDRSADFQAILKELAVINKDISLHTELRTDNIDADTAALLYEAGFRSLEIGVQTFTIEALKKSGRGTRIQQVLEGILNLRDAGIDLKIGVIPGLPGDTPQEFLNTIDILLEHGLHENIEFYPLMILPGTAIREQADAAGIQYQDQPPYYLIDNGEFTQQDIIMVKNYIQDKTGFGATVGSLPSFIHTDNATFKHGVIIRNGEKENAWQGGQYKRYIESTVFTFHIHMNGSVLSSDMLHGLFSEYRSTNQLFNLVLYSDDHIDEHCLRQFVNEFGSNSFYGRLNFYNTWREGCPVYFYQVVENIRQYMLMVDQYDIIHPVLHLTQYNVDQAVRILQDELPDVLVEESIASSVMRDLVSAYRDYPESVAFTRERPYKEFMRKLGIGLNEYAVSFNCEAI